MEWISFGRLALKGEKKKKSGDSSRLDVVEITRVALHASFVTKTCNSAHEQTPLSNDTIDSILLHREVGRTKDLSAPPRKTFKLKCSPTVFFPILINKLIYLKYSYKINNNYCFVWSSYIIIFPKVSSSST